MLPSAFISRIQKQLGEESEEFLSSLNSAPPVSIRFNPKKNPTPYGTPIPWCNSGSYLNERPSFTLDPSFHAGAYYVQEASSMFIEEIIRQKTDKEIGYTVMDLCAAPGGKTTLLAEALSENSLIIANEIVPKRAGQLMENITKWGAPNVLITQNDPHDFTRLKEVFDIILVDAPCSGEGMFRKDPGAISEWNEQMAQVCQGRQETILEDILPTLKPGGLLIYSTCTFSEEENEKIGTYLIEKHSLIPEKIKVDKSWGIVASASSGYRFYPHKLLGEGFFVSCFKKEGQLDIEQIHQRRYRERPLAPDTMSEWFSPKAESPFVLFNEMAGTIARNLKSAAFYDQFAKYLRFKKSGLLIGKTAGKDFIPDHELAMSGLYSGHIPKVEISKSMALNFLKKENFEVPDAPKGWCLITYQGLALGWVKSLGNRVNNYYPSDWRIRMKLEQ